MRPEIVLLSTSMLLLIIERVSLVIPILFSALLCVNGPHYALSGALILCVAGIFAAFYTAQSKDLVRRSAGRQQVSSEVLILISTASMLILISAEDLIAIYLAIELQSLCFYVLAASKRTSELSTEAGLKYFLLGALSSGIMLFGCSLIYAFTGSISLSECCQLWCSGTEVVLGWYLGIVLLGVGLLFKVSAVPFHMWAPDVYEGSPTLVTAFFALAPKIAIFTLMIRVFVSTFPDAIWQQLFAACSLASMIWGALAGLGSHKIKRLLAYSSIGHVGYLLIGLACGNNEGIQSLFIGLCIYLFMTLNIFSLLLSNSSSWRYIADVAALARSHPIAALTLALTMFSYAGIPPLAGFFSKWYLFVSALGSGAQLLAFFGVITSVISCVYYLRFVRVMYFSSIDYASTVCRINHWSACFVLALTLLFVCGFVCFPWPILAMSHEMALNVCV